MKAIFNGYYGVKNSGDDAFVEVSAWGAQKYWESTEQFFFAKDLPKTITPTTFYPPHKNHFNFAKAVKDVFLSDVFASAGGSTFHSALKKTDLRTYAKLKKKLGFSGKTGAIGISLGPFRNTEAEKNTIAYLKTLDFLALRDEYSFKLAQSYNLPYQPVKAFDLAALMPEIYQFNKSSITTKPQKIVGISICNYESYTGGNLAKEANRNQFIESLIGKLKIHKNILFRFFIFNGNDIMGDEKLTFEIINRLNITNDLNFEVIPYLPKVQDMFLKIAECDAVVSTRLHASIFACYSNTPFFLLEYHRKCTDFLNDVGQAKQYLLGDGEIAPQEIAKEIENIVFDQNIQQPLYIAETIERARLNFTQTYTL
ncbi:polysaccharide pyruvyl transferase family protein [Flavobacterium sp. NST-5]|uniref:Polysaccharide pyruvyl transferase family protein n=1 Tax=Flavobacterium ichthyis TaxID=2698827 RepID=A0ABW9Z7Y7_9FLAO|nr:polysaccharide pyruvyl transferase family protein [Flavobacterium ichthyis]NBL64816.1 polysaccharide pyruvyl transferase family protein [Flavobacterium ichthyis]